MQGEKIRMVITDLDGTLLNDNSLITRQNIDTLIYLGEKNICRVIATGRNLFSAKKVIPADLPVDYLVFSTGAGAVDWKTGELIYAGHMEEQEVSLAIDILKKAGMSFMVHDQVPDNHCFMYFDANCGNSDFKRRCDLYREFAVPMDISTRPLKKASQLLAIVPENLPALETITTSLPSMRVVRTTSPLDGKSMWIEIFPENISKGHTVEWLCNRLEIDPEGTVGIGNDYNDIDLLDFVRHPFAVENAPEPIRKLYGSCRCNNDSGFSDAIFKVMGAVK
jgi:Cof subfamily protein (haloacid dehalogenase superfamily)